MGLWNALTDFGHAVTGIPTADEKRNAQKQANAQIKAYKEQTELTKQEISRKRNEQAAEKRRIEEKQIRSLRRTYRAPSMLGAGANANEPGMNNKLGG